MSEKKLSQEDQYLLNMREVAQRIFATEDGKRWLEFLESTTGYHDMLPLDHLETAEGCRRVMCLHNTFLKGWNNERFLAFCYEYLAGGKLVQ